MMAWTFNEVQFSFFFVGEKAVSRKDANNAKETKVDKVPSGLSRRYADLSLLASDLHCRMGSW